MAKEVIIKLTKPATKRYVLRMSGLTVEPLFPNHNKKFEWRTKKGALNFLMDHEFRYQGVIINKDNIVVEEL